MPIVFYGAGRIQPGWGPAPLVGTLGLTCLAAGVVVGAVHGLVLVRLVGARKLV
jgi:hypothetical protein